MQVFPSGIDRIIICIASYVQDASPEVRDNAKDCFDVLGNDLERILIKYLPETTLKVVKGIMEKDRKRGTTSRHRNRTRGSLRTQRSKSSGSSLSKSKKRVRISQDFSENISEVTELVKGLSSNNWKTRMSCLEKVISGITEVINQGSNSTKMFSLIDCMCKCIIDPNSKISIDSLENLNKLIPELKSSLDSQLGLLLSSLVITLGSSNQQIKELSKEVCTNITKNCNPVAVIRPYISAVNIANPKAKIHLLACIAQITEAVHKLKPAITSKFVVPLIYKIVDDPSSEVKEQCEKLALTTYALIGETLFKNPSESKVAKVKEIISKN